MRTHAHVLLSASCLAACLCAQSEPPKSQPAPGTATATTTAIPFDLDAAFAAAQPPAAEALWTLIPWRHSLTDALAEAKATNRPVYLFVNDGDVESARC